MKVRTDVEVVVSAIDQGVAAVLGKIEQSTRKTTGAISFLQRRATQVAAGFLTLNFAKKVGEYIIEVGKAADANSDLGRSMREIDSAFGDMKRAADDTIGALLEVTAPVVIEGFRVLADTIRSAAEAFGLLEKSQRRVLEQERAGLTSFLSDAERRGTGAVSLPGNRGTFERFGGRVRETGIFSPTEYDNWQEALEGVRARIVEIDRAMAGTAERTRELTRDQKRNQKEAIEQLRQMQAFSSGEGLFFSRPPAMSPDVPGSTVQDAPADAERQRRIDAQKEADRFFAEESSKAELEDVNDRLRQQAELAHKNRDAVTAMADGWQNFGAIITDTAGIAERGITDLALSISTGLGDALFDVVSGAKSAEDAFREFALSVVKQLGQIATQYLVAAIFKQLFFGGTAVPAAGQLHGGMSGGHGRPFGGGTEPPFRYHEMQHGGIAGGRSVVVYGEGSRREAYVPLQDGRAIPVRLEGQPMSRGDTFVIYAMDSRDVVETLSQHGRVFRSAVHQGVARYGRDKGVFREAMR